MGSGDLGFPGNADSKFLRFQQHVAEVAERGQGEEKQGEHHGDSGEAEG